MHRINSSQDSNQAKKVRKSVVHRWHCGHETEGYTYIVGNTTCSVKCKIHFQHKISILLSYFAYYLQKSQVKWIINNVFLKVSTGLSLRARGQGFPPPTMSVVPGYFHWKIEQKSNQKKPIAV